MKGLEGIFFSYFSSREIGKGHLAFVFTCS